MNKHRIVQLSILASGAALICSGIFGAIHVPTGVNIAAALIIALSLAIEAPLASMAVAKHQHKPHN